jgi:hypothetical protein
MPLVALLHSERPTLFGHVIFGCLLARFHSYLPHEEPAAVTPEVPTPDAEIAAAPPEPQDGSPAPGSELPTPQEGDEARP